jgi:TRAP-type C4-dicarboxylate transport system permease small subunit
MSDDKPLDRAQARFVTKVRRLMMIASATTFIAVALVLVVIGYRIFHSAESAREADVTAHLPQGARVVATAIAGDKIVLTIEIGSSIEIRTFDLQNLRPTGRLQFAPEM